ncbi:hypothetical protein EDB86DRAFT_1099173 [Lactarius hatsudake]|nr:hypothetical protein EDB86DRAFT_1099173 [Lactarius hatsudake]
MARGPASGRAQTQKRSRISRGELLRLTPSCHTPLTLADRALDLKLYICGIAIGPQLAYHFRFGFPQCRSSAAAISRYLSPIILPLCCCSLFSCSPSQLTPTPSCRHQVPHQMAHSVIVHGLYIFGLCATTDRRPSQRPSFCAFQFTPLIDRLQLGHVALWL